MSNIDDLVMHSVFEQVVIQGNKYVQARRADMAIEFMLKVRPQLQDELPETDPMGKGPWATYYMNLSQFYHHIQNIDEAVNVNLKGLQICDFFPPLLHQRASYLIDAHKHAEAIPVLLRTIKEFKSQQVHWEIYYRLAMCYTNCKDYDNSLKYAMIALKEARNSRDEADSKLLLMRAHLEKGQYDQVLKCAPLPHDCGGHSLFGLYGLLGEALRKSGKVREAKIENEKAIPYLKHGTSDEKKSFYWSRGQIFFSLKEFSKARNAFTECIAMDPKSDEGYLQRIYSATQEKQFKLALADCEVLLQRNAQHPEGTYLKGIALCGDGQVDAGIAWMEQHINCNPMTMSALELAKESKAAGLTAVEWHIPKSDLNPVAKQEKCMHCGTIAKLKRCTRCGLAYYCSKECQARDWPTHKPKCTKKK